MDLAIYQSGLGTFKDGDGSRIVEMAVTASVTVSIPFPVTVLASTGTGTYRSLVPSPAVTAIFPYGYGSQVGSSLSSNGTSTVGQSVPGFPTATGTMHYPSPIDVRVSVP